eukprot:9213996-Pyramimonas_sp.AAC.1
MDGKGTMRTIKETLSTARAQLHRPPLGFISAIRDLERGLANKVDAVRATASTSCFDFRTSFSRGEAFSYLPDVGAPVAGAAEEVRAVGAEGDAHPQRPREVPREPSDRPVLRPRGVDQADAVVARRNRQPRAVRVLFRGTHWVDA